MLPSTPGIVVLVMGVGLSVWAQVPTSPPDAGVSDGEATQAAGAGESAGEGIRTGAEPMAPAPPTGEAVTTPDGGTVESTATPDPSAPSSDAPLDPSMTAPPPPTAEEQRRETIVVGTSEARTSGSVHVLKDAKLQRFEYDDPQVVLQSVPGVYARTEDGFGLRPNVGLRGANSDRSKKVTLLEDGVLFGPAPYSAPAAYYFPILTRMQSVRVLKGPSAIIHGPQTVGGSVELITRGVPRGESLFADVAGGSYRYGKAHLAYGSSGEQGGFVVEGVHLRNDGFKEVDLHDQGTGSRRNEWMLKGRRVLTDGGGTAGKQSLELKLGYSDEVSDETYLGLSDADFAADPNRRYSVSRFDRMAWTRTQVTLSHVLERGTFSLTTTAYRHDFDRTWRKVNGFRGAAIGDVLTRPDVADYAIYESILRGESDSSSRDEVLLIGPNHRVFVSQGLQSVARWSFGEEGSLQQSLEVGARWHFDSADRVHTQDPFDVVAGEPVPTGGATETTASNHDSTHAVAVHVVDALAWRRFALTPGLRMEVIRSKAVDRLAASEERGSTVAWMPGLGAFTALTRELGVFAGVYRGFSPPPPGQPDTVKPEQSVNTEAGVRWSRPRERVEVVGFFNDYSNLTDICTFSNGCLNANLDRQFDAGKARIWGLEAFADKTWSLGGGVSLPASVAYTFTRTRLLQTFDSADPQFGNVTAGDELPYVPRHQLSASAGVQTTRFGVHLNANFIGEMRESAGQGVAPASELTGELLTFDLSTNVTLGAGFSLYGNLRNLTDEQVIVSRRPFGARPNAPRMAQVGVKFEH